MIRLSLAILAALAVMAIGGTTTTAEASATHAAHVAARHWAAGEGGWAVSGCHRHDARTTYCAGREYEVSGQFAGGVLTYGMAVVRCQRGGYMVISSLWEGTVYVPAWRARL